MSFEFSPLGLLIGICWLAVLPISAWVSVFLALVVFFSKSVSSSLLILLLIELIAYVWSSLGGKRSVSGVKQRRFVKVLFGCLLALFGASMKGLPYSYPLVFFGLILLVPSATSVFLFSRYHERLKLSVYPQAVLIPAVVAIEILLKIKPEMVSEYKSLWEITLLSLGVFSFLFVSLFAFSRSRSRVILVYWSQAWIGLCLLLLIGENEAMVRLAVSAIAISAITSPPLFSLASQLGARFFSFAKITLIGLPGLVQFSVLYYGMKTASDIGLVWVGVVFLGCLIQALTLVSIKPESVFRPGRFIWIRFWVGVAIQAGAGFGLYWIGGGGLS